MSEWREQLETAAVEALTGLEVAIDVREENEALIITLGAPQVVAAAVIDALGIKMRGWWNAERGAHRVQDTPALGVHAYECYRSDVPVFSFGVLSPPESRDGVERCVS